MKIRQDIDRGFKFGVSWDRIVMMGQPLRVVLIHFACFVWSVTWWMKPLDMTFTPTKPKRLGRGKRKD